MYSRRMMQFERDVLPFGAAFDGGGLYGFLFHIHRALFADVAPLEERHVVYTAAEDARAGRFVLSQHDAILIGVDLQGIALCDAERAAQLDRYDDTTEFVNFSDDSCGFHSYLLLRSRPANCGEIVIQRAKAELSDYYRFTVFT